MQLKGACFYVTIKSFKGVFICKKLENHPCACPYMPTFALQLHTQPYEAKKLIKEIFVITKKTNIVTNYI
jgi:hypothetical protein